MNKRRFILTDCTLFYPYRRCQPFMNGPLLGSLVRLAPTIVDARQVVVDVRLIPVDCDAALQLGGGLRELALFLEQDTEFVMALPLIGLQRDRGAQELFRPGLVATAHEKAFGINELCERIGWIGSGPSLEPWQYLGKT